MLGLVVHLAKWHTVIDEEGSIHEQPQIFCDVTIVDGMSIELQSINEDINDPRHQYW